VPIEAGQQLLHYRLIEKIGEGGMGVVWEAVDTTLRTAPDSSESSLVGCRCNTQRPSNSGVHLGVHNPRTVEHSSDSSEREKGNESNKH